MEKNILVAAVAVSKINLESKELYVQGPNVVEFLFPHKQ